MQTHELAAGRHVGDSDLRVQVLMSINVKSLLSLVDRKSAQAPSGSTNSTRQRTLTPAFSVMEIVFALRYSNLIHEWFESLSL